MSGSRVQLTMMLIMNDARTERAELKFPWPKPLTELHKREFCLELSKLESWISGGELGPLKKAIDCLQMLEIEPPDWIYSAIQDHLRNEGMRSKRRIAHSRQHDVDQVRWATVRYLRTSRRLTWEKSYYEASQYLKDSYAAGTEETMRSSYKRVQGDPFTGFYKKDPEALGNHARLIFELHTGFQQNLGGFP